MSDNIRMDELVTEHQITLVANLWYGGNPKSGVNQWNGHNPQMFDKWRSAALFFPKTLFSDTVGFGATLMPASPTESPNA
jgi:hypothetical protein